MTDKIPRWDLSLLYSSSDCPEMQKDMQTLSAQTERFCVRNKGKLAQATPETFAKMIADYDAVETKMQKIQAYAYMNYAVAMNDPEKVDFYKKTNQKTAALNDKLLFFELEINSLTDDQIKEKMTDPSVQKYASWINRIRSGREHTVDEKTEKMLAFQHMLKNEKDPKQRFALLADKTSRTMLTTYRQIAMHHYEEEVHNGVRQKGELKAQDLNAIWSKTQRDALGPAVINDDRSSASWANVPHLLQTPFYVYGYAFGECLTSSLYQVYESGKVPDFATKYKEMLSKGASERPSEMLKPFGLDASKSDFWKQGLGMIKGYVDRLETLTDRLGMDKSKSKAPFSLIHKSKSAGR